MNGGRSGQITIVELIGLYFSQLSSQLAINGNTMPDKTIFLRAVNDKSVTKKDLPVYWDLSQGFDSSI
jgi:hypothetical protein